MEKEPKTHLSAQLSEAEGNKFSELWMSPAALTGTSWWPSSLHREIPRRRQNGSRSSCRWYPPSRHTPHFGLSQSSPRHSHLEEREIAERCWGKTLNWKICKKRPRLWASSVFMQLMICTISVFISVSFLQKGAVWVYQQACGPGAAPACHTNVLVTVTSSVFADQCFLPIFDLAEE